MKKDLKERERTNQLVRLLGLDPSKITTVNAEWSGLGPVEVSFEGKIHVSLDVWREILTQIHGDPDARG